MTQELTGEEMDWRAEKRGEVLAIARGELGSGRPEMYWRDVLGPDWHGPPPPHWCGAFALWALHAAGLARHVLWKVGLGFLEVELARNKVSVRDAQPGDVCYFNRFQHHALFVKSEPDGTDSDALVLITLDGNQAAPNRVRLQRRRASAVAAIYSIEPFLAKALDTEPAPPGEDVAT